jgi:CheY-like chemotaxis protein
VTFSDSTHTKSDDLESRLMDHAPSQQQWHLNLVREYFNETTVSVLAEITYKGRKRQSWGSATTEQYGHLALEAATNSAMCACLEMFPKLHDQLEGLGLRHGPLGSRGTTSQSGTNTTSVSVSRDGSRPESRHLSAGNSFRKAGRMRDDVCKERDLVEAVTQRIAEQESSRRVVGQSFRSIRSIRSIKSEGPAAGGGGRATVEKRAAPEAVNDGKPKVLVVDDEPVNCKMVEVALRRAGMNVTLCSDGTEVVDLMQQVANGTRPKFDIIFMDMKMRTMHGDEAAKKVRYLEAETKIAVTPIIALSGGGLGPGAMKDEEVVFRCGMQGMLLKPLNMRSFSATVAQCIFHFSDGFDAVNVEDRENGTCKFRESLVGDATILEVA